MSKRAYLFAAIVLFIIEVLIALYVRDQIIRPYGGDFLAVIFIYCLLRSVKDISVIKACITVFIVAVVIEIMQYINLLDKIKLGSSAVAQTVLGSAFDWTDIIIYFMAAVFIYMIEQMINRRSTRL